MKRLAIALAAALISSAAYAQNTQFDIGGWPASAAATANLPLCFNSLGVTEPQALCDMWPSTIPGSRPATNQDRAVVVTMAPNSATPNTLPFGVSTVIAVATGTTGAVTATMAAVAGRTNYICAFDVSGVGGTAALGPITLVGLGTTMTYQIASSAGGVILTKTFNPCLPASAANTAISVATTADGTASAVDVNITGYLK